MNTATVVGNVEGHINTDVARLVLNKGTGASCVLDFITVAALGDTAVSAMPSAYKSSVYSNTRYSDAAKTTQFTAYKVIGATVLYSAYCTNITGNSAYVLCNRRTVNLCL